MEFLVLCQQELRNGLDMATRRSGRGTRGGFAMSAGQVRVCLCVCVCICLYGDYRTLQ